MATEQARQADEVAAHCHRQMIDVMNCLYYLAQQYPANSGIQAAHATGQRLTAYLLSGMIQLDRERDIPDFIQVEHAASIPSRAVHGPCGNEENAQPD